MTRQSLFLCAEDDAKTFLYGDMERLAVCRDLLWVLYANAKTVRIIVF